MIPRKPLTAAVVAVSFLALLYVVELVDVVLPMDLDRNGIVARSLDGLDGVVWAPLLHADWAHLLANSWPVAVFAFLAMAGGVGQWVVVTATIWVVGGLGVWLTAPEHTVTVGASGLAFGWLAFLLVRGVFSRSVAQLAVAVVLLVLWGGMLWGVFPGTPGVSWQGHLFGAAGGVLAAWLVARADRPTRSTGTANRPGSLGA
ncbi:rhomboid family intramembrane serine protease [Saccharomonospora sp. NB11]|uniref:rhomboid family intramembrane serine protease n=1 Tax=Saccharomonospora sp. NB11 TaxID=1642298 RepID=UPI0018D06448|nr:rhomboid family intramembrane serine protease [Saccharomonospora sp. NB11]